MASAIDRGALHYRKEICVNSFQNFYLLLAQRSVSSSHSMRIYSIVRIPNMEQIRCVRRVG